MTFSVPANVDSKEEEEVLYDITKKLVDPKGKGKIKISECEEINRIEKKRKNKERRELKEARKKG